MRHDVVIIGGSFAGLSAALYLGRARRSVCVIDSAQPRNRFSQHAHGVFGHDGTNPAEILAAARQQTLSYPTITAHAGKVTEVRRVENGFLTILASGDEIESARILLSYGITDELPSIPGLSERWGKSVLHCPYCHGYEFSNKRLGVLYLTPMSLHQAALISEWGPTTLLLNGHDLSADVDASRMLEQRGIEIESGLVRRVDGHGTALEAVVLGDWRRIPLDALYIGPRNHPNVDIAERLGCTMEQGPLGTRVVVSSEQETSVRGIYAAGDITRFAHNATAAIADGVTAATAIHRSFVFAPQPETAPIEVVQDAAAAPLTHAAHQR